MVDPDTARLITDIAVPILMGASGVIGVASTQIYHDLKGRQSQDDPGTPHDGESEYEAYEELPQASYPE